MKCNVHPIDTAVRAGGGLFLLATPLLDVRTYPYNLLGLVPIVTGIIGYCPLYAAVRALLPGRSNLRTRHA